jgi:parallel beta-helix repeat protein/predicted outer membrane repeat protein
MSVGFALALCSTSSADTLHVPADYATIQGAINAASDGDTISIAAAIYFEFEVDTSGKAITIRGATHPDGSPAVTIDGGFQGTLLLCESGEGPDTVFQNLIVTKGDSTTGGGMSMNGTSPTLSNCVFTNNRASSAGCGIHITASSPTFLSCQFVDNTDTSTTGGGIYSHMSELTLTDCVFTDNLVYGSGGAIASYLGSITLEECVFLRNRSYEGSGGAISSGGSDLSFTNCEFKENHGYDGGGGVSCSGGSVVMASCLFANNQSNGDNALGFGQGGGLRTVSNDPTLTNCTFTGNLSPHVEGGGLFSFASHPTLTNCTFSGNVTGTTGGAIYIELGSPTLKDCTIRGNTAALGGGIYNDAGSLSLEDCTICGNTPDQLHEVGGSSYVGLGVNLITNDCAPFADPGTTFCFGDGGGTPCPCGNNGQSTGGCLNSTGRQGYLRASGDPSLWDDSIVLRAEGLVPNLPCLFFSGTNAINGGMGVSFGDGLRCVGGAAVRIQTTVSDATGVATTTNMVSTSGQSGGATISPSDVLNYQCWFREGSAGGPCGNSHNLSNGVSITWGL